jgi:hypothetical protein
MSAPLINAKTFDYKELAVQPFDTAQVIALLFFVSLLNPN